MSANFGLCHSLQISISQIWIVSPNLEASVLTALTARERREKREKRETERQKRKREETEESDSHVMVTRIEVE